MLLLVAALANAYETDQVTGRARPLADARAIANEEVQEKLAVAVALANAETRCRASVRVHRRALATAIQRETSQHEYVRDRGEFAGLGFGAYSAWLEEAPDVERRDYRNHRGIYGAVKPKDSLILGSVGVCSTVNLGGVLVGSDKTDHFFEQGYTYFLESKEGRDEARAIRWGTDSERTIYGLLTSNAFSYADLYANFQGYRFYRDLLAEGGMFRVGKYGCIEQTRPFDWAEWMNDAMDEAYNPPVYTRAVGERVQGWLAEHRDEVCEGWDQWGTDYVDRHAAVLAGRPAYVGEQAPPAEDPFALATLCASPVVTAP